jgi:Sds3-like
MSFIDFRLYYIKMKEMEAEEELIRAGTHPEYHRKLASLLERKERNLIRAKDRLEREVENIKKILAADVKAAHDTLLVFFCGAYF